MVATNVYVDNARHGLRLARLLTGCEPEKTRRRGSEYVVKCSDGRVVLVRVRNVQDVPQPYTIVDYVIECGGESDG